MVALHWVLGLIIRAASNGGFCFGIGYAIAGLPLALILGGVGLGLGIVHGIALAFAKSYDWSSVGGWFQFIADNTWSILNSFVASVYVTVNFITFNPISSTGEGTGSVILRRGVIPGYATTLGNVVAGEGSDVRDHELLHVLQARIFGPLYVPLVLLSYVICTIAPYWLIYHDRARWPITGFGSYFMNGVYPHAWNEEWAYRAT